MSETITYICSCCGEQHEDWPALTFISPDPYCSLSEEDKDDLAEISSDFCTITHPDQADYFIRCTLTQKVNGHCEDLDYGVWVSLSEKSFNDYKANYNNPNHEATYFGWLCNDIRDYKFKESIPTNVVTRNEDQRPEVIPHQTCDHSFVTDYYNGISKTEAERRIKEMIK